MSAAPLVLSLKKRLQAAVTANKTEEIISILQQLKKDVVATEDLIRETKIGITVNKLRTNPDKQVSDLVKEIVRKWKADVGQPASKKQESATASAAGSPAPSAASPAATKASSAEPKSKPEPQAAPAASGSRPASPHRRASSAGADGKGDVRTHKTDGVPFPESGATDDKTRNKCIELCYDAMASDSQAPSELILKRAKALEGHVFNENPPPAGTKFYRDKMRSLFLNLKAANNPTLREDLVSGEISVKELYEMRPQDLASEEQKAENRRIVEKNLFDAQGAKPQLAETDAFKCGKCKQNRTCYYQMQTRSADEPMTTFVTCLNCNNRWKFS